MLKSISEISKVLGMSRPTFYKLSRQPGFPKSYRMACNLVLYDEEEVIKFLKESAGTLSDKNKKGE